MAVLPEIAGLVRPSRRIGGHTAVQLRFRGLRRVLVASAQELMQDERDFVRMRCAPSDDALELGGILGDGADFHQLGFDDLRVSHSNSSIAHPGPATYRVAGAACPLRQVSTFIPRLWAIRFCAGCGIDTARF